MFDRVLRASKPTLLVWTVVALYATYFSVRTVGVHRGLGTSAYDFALYDQGLWLISRGDTPFVTLMGRNLFGDHSSFILLLLVPFYWVISSTSLLFVVQSIAIALGALPVYYFSKSCMRSEGLGALMAVLYLVHPAIGWTNLENFHPDSMLGVLVATAIWAAHSKRWRWYWAAVALALLVKEDVAFVLVPLGVWVAVYQHRRFGLITSLVSLATMSVMFLVVMRGLTGVTFRNSWRVPFGGIGGFFATLVTKPLVFARYIASEDRPMYVWQMLSPMAFVFAYRPALALVGVVMLASNVVSTFWYQHHIHYHYSLIIVPCIVMGSAWALGKMSRNVMNASVVLVATASFLTAFLWSPLPLSLSTTQHWTAQSAPVVAAREALEFVPGDVSVAAYHSVSAHLARRVEIYSFPNPFQRSLYGPDVFAKGDRLPQAETVEYVILPLTLEADANAIWQAEVSRFSVVFSNAWWVVYQRS
ncbi:MAG: DUF2079 domain-containing protein [Actinobacteria bacterium]|nr:DUF2079 domain-containing protein [Actinomycetota bacterium]MDA2999318.1 DUF2079 domain-containing protein [Actinomycetota bacterium]